MLRLLTPLLAHDRLARQNFRGRPVVIGGGLVIVATVLTVEAALTVSSIGEPEPSPRRLVLSAVLAFGALGLLDDLLGDSSVSGFGGHLQMLRRGQITTGLVKLLGGGLVSLALGFAIEDSMWVAVLDGALIALVANLANLFDRAPGRCLKVTLGAFWVFVVVSGGATELFASAVVVGAGAALLLEDLHERLMLGDTGANVLGAAIGVGIAVSASVPTKAIVVLLALALNLASERVSFSSVIERTATLRRLDRLGRLP